MHLSPKDRLPLLQIPLGDDICLGVPFMAEGLILKVQ